MHKLAPDFFVHCGDTIYADDPLSSTVALDDGGVRIAAEDRSMTVTLHELTGAVMFSKRLQPA